MYIVEFLYNNAIKSLMLFMVLFIYRVISEKDWTPSFISIYLLLFVSACDCRILDLLEKSIKKRFFRICMSKIRNKGILSAYPAKLVNKQSLQF